MVQLENLSQVLEILDDMSIPYRYHSWLNIPSAHCFATWFVPSEKFDGSDMLAMYEDYVVEIAFYYKDKKTDADFANERAFENECRGAGRYSKSNGYNSENALFTTLYTFTFKEFYKGAE